MNTVFIRLIVSNVQSYNKNLKYTKKMRVKEGTEKVPRLKGNSQKRRDCNDFTLQSLFSVV